MEKNILYPIRRLWYIFFRGTHKNDHLLFFIKSIIKYITPRRITLYQRDKILNSFYKLSNKEQEYLLNRVDYYCKFHDSIDLPDDAPQLSLFTYKNRESYIHDYVNSTYFFDAYEYTRYFPNSLRWAYNPGDVNYTFPVPEITKSRPISKNNDNRNNILLNLDKIRHFTWITDPFSWEEKDSRIIFRGDINGKPHRQRFISMWKDHPLCDLNHSCSMTLYDHLRYRYIMALEGNDVASNLKWVMSSNSAAVMPRPTYETWYMEGQLIPNYHYIEIASDYHDLIERINYYETHPEEVKAIILHAHEWVAQFQDKKREDLISLMVLDKYFRLTGQNEIKHPCKYIINEVVKLSSQAKVNAQSKARVDVTHTLKDIGFKEYNIYFHKYFIKKGQRPHHYPFFSQWLAKRQGKKFVKKVNTGDTILIQDFYLDYMQYIAVKAKQRGASVIFLVHDVQCIRFNKANSEIEKLNNASLLLVHTKAMKEKLAELGVTTPMYIIQVFDYYTTSPMMDIEKTLESKYNIIFAGNLAKSEFIKEMLKEDFNYNCKLILYGIMGNLRIDENNNVIYKGVFSPDDTQTIQGGWGLVWDGPSIDSCTGDLGDYLRYNSSHKTSLYLACGLPIIVWEKSSLASWVKEMNIGILIPNISSLNKIIDTISNDRYHKMILNARMIGEQLREGRYLRNALSKYFTQQNL